MNAEESTASARDEGYVVRIESMDRGLGARLRGLFSAVVEADFSASSGVPPTAEFYDAPVAVVVRDTKRRLIGMEGPFTTTTEAQQSLDRLEGLIESRSVSEVRAFFRLP